MNVCKSTLFVWLTVVSGCTTLPAQEAARHEAVAPTSVPARDALAPYLDVLSGMASGDATRQQATLQSAAAAASQSPTVSHRLQHAIALGMAGHAGSNPVEGQRLIGDLLAGTSGLSASETALARAFASEFGARTTLYAELARQQEQAREQAQARDDSAEQRMLALAGENARLKLALAQAERKLRAVAEMERSLLEQAVEPVEPPPQP